jgi:hypothetical protein
MIIPKVLDYDRQAERALIPKVPIRVVAPLDYRMLTRLVAEKAIIYRLPLYSELQLSL